MRSKCRFNSLCAPSLSMAQTTNAANNSHRPTIHASCASNNLRTSEGSRIPDHHDHGRRMLAAISGVTGVWRHVLVDDVTDAADRSDVAWADLAPEIRDVDLQRVAVAEGEGS